MHHAAVALVASALAAAPGLKECPAQPGLGHSACPLNATCCVEQYFGASGCIFAGTTKCCSPGPPLELSTTLPNCLVIGDSVSVQYTGAVGTLLNASCQVQHAPWVGGGSANNAASGLDHLTHCHWLRTALRPDSGICPPSALRRIGGAWHAAQRLTHTTGECTATCSSRASGPE